MLSTIIFTLLTASPFLCVQAQSSVSSAASALPTSLGNVPPCVLNCTTTAATQAGCNGAADLPCVCTSQKFQAAAGACLQAQCSASDQAVANELHNSSCVAVSSTTLPSSSTTGSMASTAKSGSVTSMASVSTLSSNGTGAANSGSVAATASASATSSSASSAASGLNMKLETSYVIIFVAIMAGIIPGTLP